MDTPKTIQQMKQKSLFKALMKQLHWKWILMYLLNRSSRR